MIVLQNKYDIGNIVTLRHGDTTEEHCVCEIKVGQGGVIQYVVALGSLSFTVYEFEIAGLSLNQRDEDADK